MTLEAGKVKWGFIPFPRTGLTCGQIGMRTEYIKWAKQPLEINHFLLMRKVLHSCMPAGKESSAERMCASPHKCLGSPMVCREHLVSRPLGLSPSSIAFLGRVLLLSSGSRQCRAPVLPAADLQRLVGENLGHLRGRRGLGVLVPSPGSSKRGCLAPALVDE